MIIDIRFDGMEKGVEERLLAMRIAVAIVHTFPEFELLDRFGPTFSQKYGGSVELTNVVADDDPPPEVKPEPPPGSVTVDLVEEATRGAPTFTSEELADLNAKAEHDADFPFDGAIPVAPGQSVIDTVREARREDERNF